MNLVLLLPPLLSSPPHSPHSFIDPLRPTIISPLLTSPSFPPSLTLLSLTNQHHTAKYTRLGAGGEDETEGIKEGGREGIREKTLAIAKGRVCQLFSSLVRYGRILGARRCFVDDGVAGEEWKQEEVIGEGKGEEEMR